MVESYRLRRMKSHAPASSAGQALSKTCVQVYVFCPQDVSISEMQAHAAGWLDDDERRRYRNLPSEQQRHTYLCAHAMLRSVLADLLAADPRCIRFYRPRAGRPMLCTSSGEDLQFSLSHSDGLTACAVGAARPVGIDVQRIDAPPERLPIARHLFSRCEIEDLARCSQKLIRRRFFWYWTLKEAYAKACGIGVAEVLNRTSFYEAVQGIPRTTLDHLGRAADRWTFWSTDVGAAHVMAVAAAPGTEHCTQEAAYWIPPWAPERLGRLRLGPPEVEQVIGH